jgi:hypothetical protein
MFRRSLPLLALAVLVAPLAAEAAVAPPAPAPALPGTAAFAVEVANDGYVVQATRVSQDVFEVRVLHTQPLTSIAGQPIAGQYATGGVTLADPAAFATCNAADPQDADLCEGLWLHGLRVNGNGGVVQVPTDGFFPAQEVEHFNDATGDGLRITLQQTFQPTYQGVGVLAVEVQNATGTHLVRGYYDEVKSALPLDALDAVPQVLRVS